MTKKNLAETKEKFLVTFTDVLTFSGFDRLGLSWKGKKFEESCKIAHQFVTADAKV